MSQADWRADAGAGFTVPDLFAAGAAHASRRERAALMRLMLGRYSISPKHLAEPGPSEEEIHLATLAALRAPDHGKTIPFRFVLSRGASLDRLADLFVDYGRRRGKDEPDLAAERVRAKQAPLVIAVIARIDRDAGAIPEHEQWAALGGAIANTVMAYHVMGYAAKMLSGARAADAVIGAAYCRPGEQLVGWISVGTPRVAHQPRGDIDPERILGELQAAAGDGA